MGSLTGAATLISYATALYGLQDCGKLARGERVLVLGAGGTVGIAAIDVARALGAKVVAMASTDDKRQLCRDRGAEIVLDSTDPAWRKQLMAEVGPVDIVVDSVGGAWSEPAFRSLAPGGRHLVVGFAAGEIARLSLNLCLLKRASVVGVNWGGFMQAEPAANRALLARLAIMLAEGRLDPSIFSVHSIEELPDILDGFMSRRSVGKPVLRLSWNPPEPELQDSVRA
jgi:NADPH2:quinone reductase